jgi:signal transduction histidine kinase
VWGADGKLLFRNDVALGQPDVGLDLPNLPDDAIVSIPIGDGAPLRVLSRRGEIAGSPVVIQVGRSEEAMRQQIRTVALILLLGLPVGVATAGLGGYMLARRALAPIERMTERAETITAERLSDRLPVSNPDNEMGRLATVFNATLARLEESFGQMRRFTADVSHELRTPLTAIRSVGEVGLRGPPRRSGIPHHHRQHARGSGSARGLVDRLLTLSRAETGVGDALDRTGRAEGAGRKRGRRPRRARGRKVAASRGRSARLAARARRPPHASSGAHQSGGQRDQVRARRLGNRHSRDRINVARRGSTSSIAAPAMPAAEREHIFDRFFRASSAPADVAGTGLGLSIAKSAVETSGGILTLERSDANGSTFRIKLPRG